MPAAASPESTEFLQQLQPGQKLAGCYLLIRRITGAPGRVFWLANDEVLGKDVALQFLPQELVGQSDVAERLRQAVKRSRPLIHHHILRTYDFIEEDGWSAISTDAFEGPTMAGLLEDGAREVAEVQPWVELLCKTLDEAHRIRIMHAGLSPFDITVNSKGELKVMNFGISAVILEAQRASRSEFNQRALSYLSAEQLTGEKATVADDIFSLGAVVHEFLAGEPPFRGDDRESVPPTIKAHRETLGHRGDPVPASWERAIAAALATDASLRPTSASKWWELANSPVAGDEIEKPAVAQTVAPIAVVERPSTIESDDSREAATDVAQIPDPISPVEPAVEATASVPVGDIESQHELHSEDELVSRPEAAAEAVEATPQSAGASVERAAEPIPAEPLSHSEGAPSQDDGTRTETEIRSRHVIQKLEPTTKAGAVSEPESTSKPEAQPKEEIMTDEKPRSMERKPRSFRPDPFAPVRERATKLEAPTKRQATKPRETVGATTKQVAAIPPEDLAATVRREEAEQEARELGYYGDDEGYVGSGRKVGGARMALPIVGAAVGLLILFGVIKLLVGSPDTGGTRSSTTSVQSTPVPVGSGNSDTEVKPVPSAAGPETTRDTTKIASVPEATPRVDPSVEPPETKSAPEPSTAKVEPPSATAEPAKTPAEEHEAALQKVRELETRIASAKKEIEGQAKALPQILKGADEIGTQQKKREDAAKKAEQAADQAEQAATEKRRIADEARKSASDLAEQNNARREEHAKAQESLTTLRSSLTEDEKALAEAKNLAAAAAQRVEAEAKKSAPAEQPVSVATPLPEKEDSEAAKARNDERKRIDAEMLALRQKLAEQAKKLGASLDSPRSVESPTPSVGATVPEPLPLPTKEEPAPAPAGGTTSAPVVTGNNPELALNKTNPPPLPDIAPKPADTQRAPKVGENGEFMNSLGMKFVAVTGTDVTFCIWPTRVRDFETFARATGLKSTLWKDPGFKQAPDHPVVNVTWQEAIAFCKWLTSKEQKEGLLSSDQAYRLPTDLEWSLAVGLTNESGRTPEERDMSVPDIYPWGTAWPPPPGSGNYTGEETGSDVAIKGYDDGYPWTSPVGSFPANKAGLFDMGGNVWEWCMDTWNSESKARVLRGASWYNGALKLSLLSSCRVHASPDSGTDNYGFRAVIARESGKGKR